MRRSTADGADNSRRRPGRRSAAAALDASSLSEPWSAAPEGVTEPAPRGKRRHLDDLARAHVDRHADALALGTDRRGEIVGIVAGDAANARIAGGHHGADRLLRRDGIELGRSAGDAEAARTSSGKSRGSDLVASLLLPTRKIRSEARLACTVPGFRHGRQTSFSARIGRGSGRLVPPRRLDHVESRRRASATPGPARRTKRAVLCLAARVRRAICCFKSSGDSASTFDSATISGFSARPWP